MGPAASSGTAYRGSAQTLRRAGNMSHELRKETVQGEGRAPVRWQGSVHEAVEILGATVDGIRNHTQKGRSRTNVTVAAGCGCCWTPAVLYGTTPRTITG